MIDWTCLQIPLLVSHLFSWRLWDCVKEKRVKAMSIYSNDWLVSSCFSAEPWLTQVATIPQTLGGRGVSSFRDYLPKGWLPGSWEQHSWVVKLAKAWEKIYISKSQKKNLQLQIFQSQCPKKREVKKKTYINVSQADGNKSILSYARH